MPNIPQQDRIVAATDQQRASLLESSAAEEESSDGNLVKEQLAEQEEMDEVGRVWSQVHDAVRAAEEACRKLKDENEMSPEDAYLAAFEDFLSVLEEMKGEKSPFTEMEEESRAIRDY